GKSGILVPAQSPNDLAEALHNLLVDPTWACSLGAAAAAQSEAFTADAIGARYVDLLQQIVSPRATGRSGRRAGRPRRR
ncbi:MAG: glycosyltransferase, partial [Mycobacteriales bacterium]